jgi:hypothetical protein
MWYIPHVGDLTNDYKPLAENLRYEAFNRSTSRLKDNKYSNM